MTKAVVLLSGGLDSTTCLAIAAGPHGYDELLALSIYYGQSHGSEIDAAQKVAAHYGAEHRIVVLDRNLFIGAGSALIQEDEVPMPHLSYQEIAEGVGPSPTYVPFRNANLLSVATTIALTDKAEAVYFGAHAEDARGWAYPDCTPEFIGAMANAILVGTYQAVRLVTPLQWMMKRDIVRVGLELQAPYMLTLSCYEGKRPACGKCPTCVERLEAFKANSISDAIPYEAGVPMSPVEKDLLG